MPTAKENDRLLEIGIKRAVREEKTKFPSIRSFETFCELTAGTVWRKNERLKCIKDAGIEIKINQPLSSEETDRLIDKGIENAHKNEIKEFSSIRSFEIFCEVTLCTIWKSKKRLKRIKDAGIKLHQATNMQEVNKLVNIGLEKALETSEKFSSIGKFEEFCEVSRGVISGNLKRRKHILSTGIILNSNSKKTIFSVETLAKNNIQLNSRYAFFEYSSDILDLNTEKEDTAILYTSLIKEFSDDEITNILNNILLELNFEYEENNQDGATPWIMEIKLELLDRGFYFDEQTILSTLSLSTAINYSSEDVLTDGIEKRLRYTKKLIDHRHISVDYADELPLINNTGNIIILNEIKDKKTFLKLWKEYSEFLIRGLYIPSVSRSKIPDNWKNIDELANVQPSYAAAYLLNKEGLEFLKQYGYEGIAAIAKLSFLRTKAEKGVANRGLPASLQSLRARASGFFLWLTMKEKALSHPSYLRFYGATALTQIANDLLSKHKHMEVFEIVIKSDSVPKALTKKAIWKHTVGMASALHPSYDPMSLQRKDFESYIESSVFNINSSGSIAHKSYIEKLFIAYGNKEAIMLEEDETLSEYQQKQIRKILLKDQTLNTYAKLISSILQIAEHRLTNKEVAWGTVKNFIRYTLKVIKFLETVPSKPNREEMGEIMNPIIKHKSHCFYDWITENGTKPNRYTGTDYKMLFDETNMKEYRGIFSQKWILNSGKESKGTGIKRRGMTSEVYRTLQEVAFHNPAEAKQYVFLRNTPDGNSLDLSWWKHNFSPIPVVCLWLITKLPRRALNIANLDLDRFMQYDDEGNFEGFFINTDKNKEMSKIGKDFIPSYLVHMSFNSDELLFLKNYVDYIKNAYSFMPKVDYPNKGYEKFKPLFPNSDYKKAITKNVIDNLYNKLMLITQFEVQRRAKNGEFDENFNEHEREAKTERLKNIQLVFNKKNKDRFMPNSLEDMIEFNYPDSAYRDFTTIDGIHNLRGVGATELLLEGAHYDELTIITGHANEKILKSVYLKITKDNFRRVAPDMYISGHDKDISPVSLAEMFIEKTITPLIESPNPELVLDSLMKNGFQTQSFEIESSDKAVYGKLGVILVENGLDIASKYHPLGNWETFNYGICTMKNRCPKGIQKQCSLCPHLMFNLTFAKGINYKLLECQLESEQLKTKITTARLKGDNSERTQLVEQYNSKMKEFYGYWKILSILSQQNQSSNADTPESDNSSKELRKINSSSSIFEVKDNSFEQLMLNTLIMGKELKIDNLIQDSRITEITHAMLTKSYINKDYTTSEKLLSDGLDWFMNLYSNSDDSKRIELVERYIKEDVKKIAAEQKRITS